MAQLHPTPYPMPPLTYTAADWRTSPHEVAFKALSDTSQALPEDQIVGALLSWPVADGAAFYLVVKDKPLTLRWVPFGDAWQVDAALIRGLRRQDVERMMGRERALAAIFRKSS